jgi:hypothetical protein
MKLADQSWRRSPRLQLELEMLDFGVDVQCGTKSPTPGKLLHWLKIFKLWRGGRKTKTDFGKQAFVDPYTTVISQSPRRWSTIACQNVRGIWFCTGNTLVSAFRRDMI